MGIKRVIRFQDDLVDNSTKMSERKKSKVDVKHNDDIIEDTSSEIFDDFEEEQEQLISSHHVSDELIRYIENILSGRTSTNMIGVFGINADRVVNNMNSKLQELRENIIFVGQVDCSLPIADAYNGIAAVFLDYLLKRYDLQAMNCDMNFYAREIVNQIGKVYNDSSYSPYYDYESSLTALARMNRINGRDRILLSAIDKIRKLENLSSYSRNLEPKFLVTVEMERLDYKMISNLSKLNSLSLIIVVYSILDYTLAGMSLDSSIGVGSLSYMNKFFNEDNSIIAGVNTD